MWVDYNDFLLFIVTELLCSSVLFLPISFVFWTWRTIITPLFFSWAPSLPSLLFVNNPLLLTLLTNSNNQYFLCMETFFRHDILFYFFSHFWAEAEIEQRYKMLWWKGSVAFCKALPTDRASWSSPTLSSVCMGFFSGPRKSSHMRQTRNQEEWESQRNTGRGRRWSLELQASWPSH